MKEIIEWSLARYLITFMQGMSLSADIKTPVMTNTATDRPTVAINFLWFGRHSLSSIEQSLNSHLVSQLYSSNLARHVARQSPRNLTAVQMYSFLQ